METEYSIELIFDDKEDVDEAWKELEQNNGKDIRRENRQGLTGIEIALLCLMVSSGLFNLVKRIMRQFKCGVIVDARTKRVVISKNCELPRGSVTIIKKDGTSAEYKETDDAKIDEYLKNLKA